MSSDLLSALRGIASAALYDDAGTLAAVAHSAGTLVGPPARVACALLACDGTVECWRGPSDLLTRHPELAEELARLADDGERAVVAAAEAVAAITVPGSGGSASAAWVPIRAPLAPGELVPVGGFVVEPSRETDLRQSGDLEQLTEFASLVAGMLALRRERSEDGPLTAVGVVAEDALRGALRRWTSLSTRRDVTASLVMLAPDREGSRRGARGSEENRWMRALEAIAEERPRGSPLGVVGHAAALVLRRDVENAEAAARELVATAKRAGVRDGGRPFSVRAGVVGLDQLSARRRDPESWLGAAERALEHARATGAPAARWSRDIAPRAPEPSALASPGVAIHRRLVKSWALAAVPGRDIDRLVSETLSALLGLLRADRCSLWAPGEVGWFERAAEEAAGRRVAAVRTDEIVSRAADRGRAFARASEDGSACAAVPLVHADGVLGVLAASGLREQMRAEDEDLADLEVLAAVMTDALSDADTLADVRRRRREVDERLRTQTRELRRLLRNRAGVIGDHPKIREVLRTVERVAPANMPVLVSGETGTGKEDVARLVHRLSERDGAFTVVDCGALPASLLENELFGHEKGAFTGAGERTIGRFEEADGGTILLDEIGELPLQLQPRLLRALQESRVRRIGGDREIPLDFRLVAATNRDLAAMVRQGRFREDLFFRLRVVHVSLPPLRQRGDDVLLLALYFLRRHCAEVGRDFLPLSDGAQEALLRHAWPGNVRELQNRLRRAAVMAAGAEITQEDLQLEEVDGGAAAGEPDSAPDETTAATAALSSRADLSQAFAPRALEEAVAEWFWDVWVTDESDDIPPQDAIEAFFLRAAMRAGEGSLSRAAEILGMHVDQFRRHLDRLGHPSISRGVRGHGLGDVIESHVAVGAGSRSEMSVVDRASARLLDELLIYCRGNKSRMARHLGWSRHTLARKLRRLEVVGAGVAARGEA